MNMTFENMYGVRMEYIATKILTVSCYCITFIVGIIGNGLVIWISGFRMKTVSSVWFLNLAIADFIFCLSLPVRVMDWLYISKYLKFPDIFSRISDYLNISMLALNCVVSVTFLTVINVHRCVSIMWPLWAKVHCTRRLVQIASVFLWIVPLTCSVLINIFSLHGYNSVMFRKYFLRIPRFALPRNYIIYSDHTLTINSVLTFGIPFIIIIFCNALIIFKLCSNKFKKPNAFNRTFRLIIAVVVCFFICWFPFCMWPLIAMQVKAKTFVDFIISNICLCLISISSCMNPILYVLLGHTRGAKSKNSINARMENAINDFK